MDEDEVTAPPTVDAGDFSSWLSGMHRALREEAGSDVPCGTCTACCTSSQFVHIAPDETATLRRIPKALLFSAPGLPTGHVLMGYDERGHCPMLRDGACTIYEHRPRTCRTYDCRVFPAAGLVPDDDKPRIAERARQWRFTFADDAGRARQGAAHAAATYLQDRRDRLPEGTVPANPTQLAVLAVEVHDAFLGPGDGPGAGPAVETEPEHAVVERAVALRARRRR
jgi:Fe-S-cluster containining protein